MMLEKMEEDAINWKDAVKSGNITVVKGWLVENVHKHGNLYDPADLIKKITGRELTVEPFLSYLDDKYSKLYGY